MLFVNVSFHIPKVRKRWGSVWCTPQIALVFKKPVSPGISGDVFICDEDTPRNRVLHIRAQHTEGTHTLSRGEHALSNIYVAGNRI